MTRQHKRLDRRRARRQQKFVAVAAAAALILSACTSGSSEPSAPAAGSTTEDATDVTSPTAGQTESTTPPDPSIVRSPASGYSNTGGGYLGNPIWATGPGNIPIGGSGNNEVAIRFIARDSGQSTAASYIIKFDDERPNYQGGNCGILNVSLRADDGGGQPSDSVLAETTFDDPCGGGGSVGWLTNQAWDAPADLIGGQPYHLVFANLDPDPATNWVSINLLYRPSDDANEVAFSTGDGELSLLARGSEYWSGAGQGEWGRSSDLQDHYPTFEIHYADGWSQGISYIGARWGQEVTLSPESASRMRQSFVVSDETIITSLHFAGDIEESSADAAGRATLAVAGGPDLITVELTKAAGEHWFVAQFPTPLTLDAGETYTVVVEGTAGVIYVRPLYEAQHNEWISTDQSDWANTTLELDSSGTGDWQPYVPGIPHDLSLYFTTLSSDDPAIETSAESQLEPTTVALLGDSLIGGPDFEEEFRVALTARGVDVPTLVSESGQNISELKAALDVEVPVADIIVVANTINGEDTGAEFEAGVRDVVAKIRESNPDSDILWVEAHATTARYDYIVDERVTPRNKVLVALDAEGLIQLVPWFDTAEANQWIYTESADGVHFFGSQQLYATTLVNAIDNLLS